MSYVEIFDFTLTWNVNVIGDCMGLSLISSGRWRGGLKFWFRFFWFVSFGGGLLWGGGVV